MRQIVGRPVGLWMRYSSGGGGDDQPWWFESGGLAIDFAYTGGMGIGPEAWAGPGDLEEWLSSRYPEIEGPVGERELMDALALRDAIARGLLAGSRGEGPEPDDVDVINLYAATPDIPPSLGGGNRQAGRHSARVGQALSELARQAVELFAPRERERIRECAADDCEIVFYDDSRSDNRRWCSMQRCGNRAKVRKHRAKAGAY